MVDGDQYFIDRNGDYFVPLLDYLHTGHWHVPQHLDPRMVLREADFYGIEPNWETNLTDETIPLLRKRMEKALDTQGERAVEKIKKGLLRQLRKGRGLALVILEDREHLKTRQETVLFDSSLFACLANTSKGEMADTSERKRVRKCLADHHFLSVSIGTNTLCYDHADKDWMFLSMGRDDYWVRPKVVCVYWTGSISK